METEKRNDFLKDYQMRRTQAELRKQAEETKKYFEDRQTLVDAGISVGLHQREMTEKAQLVRKDKDLFGELDDLLKQMIKDTCDIADGMAKSFGLNFDSGRGRGR
jgi:hypothetical protein